MVEAHFKKRKTVLLRENAALVSVKVPAEFLTLAHFSCTATEKEAESRQGFRFAKEQHDAKGKIPLPVN